MVSYEKVVEDSWQHICDEYEKGRFAPELEEDIQCFLYHVCLLRLEDATRIHAKVSRGEKARKGKWVFPDLSLGNDDLVVEIKFVGKNFTTQQASRVKRTTLDSMNVMSNLKWYEERKRILVFFDERKHFWWHDREEILKQGPKVQVLFYPREAPRLNDNGSVVYPHGWNE